MSIEKSETGSCLCGNVQLTLIGEPSKKGFCFCSDCRQLSGSIGQIVCFWHVDKVKVNDESKLQVYQTAKTDSGMEKPFSRCKDCGTVLYSVPMSFGGDTLVVRPSALAGIDWQKYEPDFAVHSDEKCPWIEKIASF